MERQKQNEMVWTHNPVISGNDEERKNHIDDGERTAATTDDGDDQSTTYRNHSVTVSDGLHDGVDLMFERKTFPKISTPPFHTRQRRKAKSVLRQSKQSTPQVGWRWPMKTNNEDNCLKL